MTIKDRISSKLINSEEAKKKIAHWRLKKDHIVFTNGCFDILHRGHLEYLANSADLGNKLIIGLNSDDSVKKIKGDSRPINDQISRSFALAALGFIDAIVIFDEETPEELIKALQPDVLVKGSDYSENEIVGSAFVKKNGGEVKTIPLTEGFSTTNIIEKIKTL
mgnify:CR=1 FL=1